MKKMCLKDKVTYFIRTLTTYNKLETSFNKAGKNKGEGKTEQHPLRGRGKNDYENVNGKRNLKQTVISVSKH